MIRQRNETLDIAKGVGIILVVLGHNWLTIHAQGELYRIIFSFHVPLFFFLSGVFLRPSQRASAFFVARFHSLLKPYFTVMLAVGAVKFIDKYWLAAEAGFNLSHYLFQIVYGTGTQLFLSTFSVSWIALWFLPHLFFASCIAFWVLRYVKNEKILTVIAIISFVVGVRLLPTNELPWSIDLAPITTPLLIMGYVLGRHLNALNFQVGYFLLSALSFVALHFVFNETVDLNTRAFGQFFIATAQILLGIYIVLSLSSLISRNVVMNKVFAYIGSGTLFILLFHWIVQAYFFEVLARMTFNQALSSIIALVAGVFIPLLLYEIAQRSSVLAAMLLPRRIARAAENIGASYVQ